VCVCVCVYIYIYIYIYIYSFLILILIWILKRAAYSIRITYIIIVNTVDPKCPGNCIWICSYQKAWWWLCRAETCRLECVFNNKLDVFDWKNLHFVIEFESAREMEHLTQYQKQFGSNLRPDGQSWKYRVIINSFPHYKHLLQENYNCNKRSTCWSVLMFCKKTSWVELHFEKKKICLYSTKFSCDKCL